MALKYELYRYDVRLTQLDATTNAHEPAASVTVDMYREGAWANGGSTGTTITVYDPGSISAGDTIFLNTTTGTTRTVSSVTATTIVLSSSFTWSDGDRIIPNNRRPLTYTDDAGSTATSTASQVTTDSNGEAYFYSKVRTLDMITNDGSGNLANITDQTGLGGKMATTPLDWALEADGDQAGGGTDDYAALVDQIAYIKAKGGGVLELPPGNITLGGDTEVLFDGVDNLEIRGQGRGITYVDWNFSPVTGNGWNFTSCDDVSIRGITFGRTANVTNQIHIDTACNRISISDCHFVDGGNGIFNEGVDTRVRDVWFTGSNWTSFIKERGTRLHVNSLVARPTNNWTNGIDVDTGSNNTRLTNIDIAPIGAVTSAGGVGIRLRDAATGTDPRDIVVVGAYLVGGTSTGTSPAIQVTTCEGAEFIGCSCVDSSIGYDIDGGTGISIIGGTVIAAQNAGVDIDAGSDIRINGLASSDLAAGAGYAHIDVAATVSDVNINGLYFGNFARGGGGTVQHGVWLRAGAGDNITVSNVQGDDSKLSGSVVLDDKDHTTSPNVRVHHNLVQDALGSHDTYSPISVVFTDDDTTPSVLGAGYISLSYSAGPIVVTDLDDGYAGQIVVIKNSGANTITLDHGAGANGFFFTTGGDLSLTNGDSVAVVGLQGGSGVVWTDITDGVINT